MNWLVIDAAPWHFCCCCFSCQFQLSAISRRLLPRAYKCDMCTHHPLPNISLPSSSPPPWPTNTVAMKFPPHLCWCIVRRRRQTTCFVTCWQFSFMNQVKIWIHFNFLLALSIHQLAAQGEMVFLASRIEQGGWNYGNVFKNTVFSERPLLHLFDWLNITTFGRCGGFGTVLIMELWRRQ